MAINEFDWFDWRGFLNMEFAVCCKNKYESIQFCKIMHEKSLTWSNGESYLSNTNWYDGMDTILYYGDGTFGRTIDDRYKAIYWSDLIRDEECKILNIIEPAHSIRNKMYKNNENIKIQVNKQMDMINNAIRNQECSCEWCVDKKYEHVVRQLFIKKGYKFMSTGLSCKMNIYW